MREKERTVPLGCESHRSKLYLKNRWTLNKGRREKKALVEMKECKQCERGYGVKAIWGGEVTNCRLDKKRVWGQIVRECECQVNELSTYFISSEALFGQNFDKRNILSQVEL